MRASSGMYLSRGIESVIKAMRLRMDWAVSRGPAAVAVTVRSSRLYAMMFAANFGLALFVTVREK